MMRMSLAGVASVMALVTVAVAAGAALPAGADQMPDPLLDHVPDPAPDRLPVDVDPRAVEQVLEDLDVLDMGEDDPAQTPPDEDGRFADSIAGGVRDQLALYSTLGAAAAIAGLAGFAFVTRRVSPREALKNPQRAMIYGFIRATPGAHLKRLSEEFGMKSSSILWHVRKLEAADLVRSQRANGYRVFHPVAGGHEIRRLSRGTATLHNRNARRAMEHLEAHPGSAAQTVAEATGIHPGTVRWHLRKLRDFGLVEESGGNPALFFVTPLGHRAMHAEDVGQLPSIPSAPALQPESA